MRRSARSQPLPLKEQKHLLALVETPPLLKVCCYSLYMAGWTLSAIGDALGKARSTVRSWIVSGPYPFDTTIPKPADKSYVRRRPISPGISPTDKSRLAKLAPIARRYRARLAPTHSATLANNELTDLTRALHATGVSIQQLADATGVTYRAMYRRVKNVR